MGIPSKIRSSLSPVRIIVAILGGVCPAILLIACERLPGWLRVWIWLPVAVAPAVLVFARFDGYVLYEHVLHWFGFVSRRRRLVWRHRREADEAKKVVVKRERGQGQWQPGEILREIMSYAAITVGFFVLIGLLGLCLQWLVGNWLSVRASRAASVVRTTPTPAILTSTRTPWALASATPTPRSTVWPTVPPTPAPTAWAVEHTWDVAAESGHLELNNRSREACSVAMASSGWEYVVVLPDGVESKTLVVPLLLSGIMSGPSFDGILTIRSTCSALDVELIPYQAYVRHRSDLWLIPVCDPPGLVTIRPHGTAARVGILGADGRPDALEVSHAGRFATAPQPSKTSGCWVYWLEAERDVFAEVIVMAR